jgi:hypothetical protein
MGGARWEPAEISVGEAYDDPRVRCRLVVHDLSVGAIGSGSDLQWVLR